MALAVELQVDAVVDDSLAVHALADAGVAQKVDRALLENARADAVLDVFAAAVLEHDALDAVDLEQPREREPGRAGADDADLRSQSPSSSTRWKTCERAVRGRDAAVDGGVQQHLADLLRRETVPARGADVQRELVEAAERDQRGQRDAAARSPVKARARPDLAPRVARDEVLEVGGLVRRAFDRAVDVLVAEHLPADAHPALVRIVGHAEVRAQRVVELVRALDVREVRGARDRRRRVAFGISAASASTCSGGDVGSSAPATASVGRLDRAELAAQVELAQDLAVAHVCLGRRGEEHRAEALHVAERRCEPARQNGVGDRFHAARAYERDALVPRLCASPNRADVHASTSRSSRSGASSASRMPTAPAEREADEREPLALHACPARGARGRRRRAARSSAAPP